MPPKKNTNNAVYTPPISYRRIEHFYFIHGHIVYSVVGAPSEVFKAAIEQAMDTKRLTVLTGAIEEAREILSGDLDLFARWWLLSYVALQHTARPMQLYGSKGEAEQALNCEAQAVQSP